MGSKAALVPERAMWVITNGHSQSCQLIVSRVNVHPHDKLACPGVVHDLGALQDHRRVNVRVGAPLQCQPCNEEEEDIHHKHPCMTLLKGVVRMKQVMVMVTSRLKQIMTSQTSDNSGTFVQVADTLLLRQLSMILASHASSTLIGPVYKVLGGVDADSYNVHPRR